MSEKIGSEGQVCPSDVPQQRVYKVDADFSNLFQYHEKLKMNTFIVSLLMFYSDLLPNI